MTAKLILSLDGKVVQEYPLDKERVSVGRKQHNDIVIDNMAVSGDHAVLVTHLNETVLEDLDSTNGVMVNDQPIDKHLLQNNDVIKIGRYGLKYVSGQPEPLPVEEEAPVAPISAASGASSGKRQVQIVAGIFLAATATIVGWQALKRTPAAPVPQVAHTAAPASPPPVVAPPPVAPQPEPVVAATPEPVVEPTPVKSQSEGKRSPKNVRVRKEENASKTPDAPVQQPGVPAGGVAARQDEEPAPKKAPAPAAKEVPQHPRTPAELCADRSNFISRNLCELRTCQMPEWTKHPFCVKLREQQSHNREKFL